MSTSIANIYSIIKMHIELLLKVYRELRLKRSNSFENLEMNRNLFSGKPLTVDF